MKSCVVVRGAGDLATGTILRLHQAGFSVLAVECATPTAIRRKAALCEAVYAGTATVEGVTGRCIAEPEQAEVVWADGEIPILVDEQANSLTKLQPMILVDAILAKKNLGTEKTMAPITVALGPGFTAGQDVDAVVETMRGHDLGRVYYTGEALPNTGVPGMVGGFAKERVIHAPDTGHMCFVMDAKGKEIDIGSIVQKGQVIAFVGDTPVQATLDGVLRGLIRAGYPVHKGLKIADIDPRIEEVRNCVTVSDKARSIAGGVLEAILHLANQRGMALF